MDPPERNLRPRPTVRTQRFIAQHNPQKGKKRDTMDDDKSGCPSALSSITMSFEQFKQLLAAVASGSKHKRSMVRCPVKFSGNKSASEVESFLAAVCVFKKVELIEDEDVLTDLILTNDAATWWQGIKNQVKTWSQFEERLRHAFAPKNLAYKR